MINNKRTKFVKLAERRMSNAINQLRLIKNLSNKNNYEYYDSDWKKMHKDLTDELNSIKIAFSANENKKKKWTLKK